MERIGNVERGAPSCAVEHGLRTLVINRTRRGENGRGVVSRWYPETLANQLAVTRIHTGRNSSDTSSNFGLAFAFDAYRLCVCDSLI